MSSVVLTTSGASFMAQAGTMFPAMPIRYCLFSYDYRLDPYVLPTSGLTTVLSADTTSAVGQTFGEIIYNIDSLSAYSYSISNNEFLIFDSNQLGTSTISGNRFNDTTFITLRSGVPLSNVISGSSIVYNYPNWTVNGYTLVTGNNSAPSGYVSSRDKYFRVNSFAPISSAAGGQAAGLFKVLIDNTKGNFKFNKILLYATRILSGGIEDTSIEPVLVGIAYLNSPVIKSNDGTNLNFFEADIEVQFSANNYFGNVSYLNNNNWNYVGGEQMVWFDGKVSIGTSAIPGSWLARAKLHISESNPAIPFFRLTTDNLDGYVDTFVSHSTVENLITQTGSKSNLIYYLNTSGSSNYSEFKTRLDSDLAKRYFLMTYVHPVSGIINTGWESNYSGYLETTWLSFDSNILATFRSKNSTYGTLVLGQNSESNFEHTGKFLTVHGGTLLVGSTQVSGSVSGNSPWFTSELLLSNTLQANGVSTLNGGIIFGVGMQGYPGTYIYTDNFRANTSAAFYNKVLMSGLNSLSSPILSANGYIVGGNLYSRDSISSQGNLFTSGIGFLNGLVVSGTSLFNSSIITNGIQDQGEISTTYFYTNGMTIYNDAFIVGNMTLNGNIFGNGNIINYGNFNVSGLGAFGSNINIDNGDLLIRGAGKGIKVNTTGSAPIAGRTQLTGGSPKQIYTGAVQANSIILITLESNVGASVARILYKTPGVNFAVMYEGAATTDYINWLIINPTP